MAKSDNNMKKFWTWLKQYTILYHLVVVALVFLGLAIASCIAMALGTRHSSRRTVPDFVGLQLNDANYFAERRDLNIIINDSLYVSAYPGGVVLDQLPKGGVVVKPGRKIYVTINSSRQRMVSVPYVAGRSLRQAKNMLETAGLTIDHLEYAEDIATNYVLAEYVNGEEVLEESNMQAEKGSGVVLRVGIPSCNKQGALGAFRCIRRKTRQIGAPQLCERLGGSRVLHISLGFHFPLPDRGADLRFQIHRSQHGGRADFHHRAYQLLPHLYDRVQKISGRHQTRRKFHA